MRALRWHTRERWVLLYVERWLEAELEMPDGRPEVRVRGTPQGGVVAPPTQKVTSSSSVFASLVRKG